MLSSSRLSGLCRGRELLRWQSVYQTAAKWQLLLWYALLEEELTIASSVAGHFDVYRAPPIYRIGYVGLTSAEAWQRRLTARRIGFTILN